MTKQSKRAAFAAKMKQRRRVDAIYRANHSRPGFAGVVHNLTITLPSGEVRRSFGIGALFVGTKGQ